LGLIETTKNALTPQQKVLAAQALIYEQTADAQGDFARTSDGLANQQRVVAAQWENMQATLGEALLPVQLAFTSALSELLTAVLPPLASFIVERLIPGMEGIANVLRDVAGPAIEWIRGLFDGMGGTLDTAGGKYSSISSHISAIMNGLRTLTDTVLGAIRGFWEQNGEAISRIAGNWFETVETIFTTWLDVLLGLIETFIQLLNGDFEGAGETLKGVVETLWEGIKAVFRLQLDSLRTIFGEIDWAGLGRNIIEGIGNGISGAAGLIADAARNAARSAYEAAKSWLGISSPSRVAEQRIGKPFAQGIATGIEEELRAITAGVGSGLNGMMGGLAMQAAPAPALAGPPISITINMTGGADGAQAARSGVLSALRQAGLA
jgi:phage-related protein